MGGGAAVSEDQPFALLPPYLTDSSGAQPEAGANRRTYGTLSYNKRRNCWVVKGDPSVTELCKRLFPGTETSRRGEARFTAHRRIVGELNWLMLRYPLTVRASDMARWEAALSDAREYVVRRELARALPERVTPSPTAFHGTLTGFQEEGLAFLLRTGRGPIGRRDGPGQNRAGAGHAIPNRRVSRADCGPAAFDAQLAKRDCPLCYEA